MAKFTNEDALKSRWSPSARGRAVGVFAVLGLVLLGGAVGVGVFAQRAQGTAYVLVLLATVAVGLSGVACLGTAFVIQFARLVGRVLLALGLPLFAGFLVSLVVIAWLPALLYGEVDQAKLAILHGAPGTVSVDQLVTHYAAEYKTDTNCAYLHAGVYIPWLFQFQIVRDVITLIGAVGFVSLVAMFGIWWERKVAGRMQSRLGPMRVGGWHGWAQSMADGIKLIQKEDIFLEGADRLLFRMAPYIAFMPALTLFVALPFSAAWVGRDLDVGLIFIFAMIGVGVVGVLLGGWASNNKWSMYGAMREACQMISYEIPLGLALLVPIMLVGTLQLTKIGAAQSGGFHTWLAFQNPFAFAASVVFFIATLASCKRAPFDLPEAESELVAGYMTEYSGFRWSLFMFGEYAEMWAVGGLAAILFFGAWYSPLPAEWGTAWAHGTLWQRALHGVVYSGPLWFIFKGFFFFFVQLWLRWTLPRIRLDQVMYACVQVLLPLMLVVLLGNTLWMLFVRDGGIVALVANFILTAIGAVALMAILWVVVSGYANGRRLVGTQAVNALPGA